SLRGEQRLRAAARGQGLQGFGAHPDREPAGNDGAARPSLLRRRAVPSGVHLDAARGPPAVQGLRRRGAALSRRRPASGRRSVNLCGFDVGLDRPLFLIAGPDTLESEQLCIDVAGKIKEHTAKLGMPYIFKGSFDKANRTSGKSYRGPGMEEGLRILSKVKQQMKIPVLTDVHEDTPLKEVASVVDVIQTPAFLCRQTNFIRNAASQGKPVNIKK